MPGYAFATGMEFAAPAVDVLCAQGDPPALLIGYPPGLRHRSGYAPLAEASARHGIPLLETADINDGQALAEVRRLGLDLFVIAGWSQLIREPLLSACPLGAIGLHPTRLPFGRGRAPLPWTIIKGLTTSAVSLFFLKPGVDDGDIIDQAEFTVTRRDDVASVYRKVTEINIALLAKHIPAALRGEITATPQPPGGSVWPKRRPDDGAIDWNQPAAAVYDWIRALGTPYPGAFTAHRGRRLWIHTADLIEVGIVPAGAAKSLPEGRVVWAGQVVGPVWSTSAGGVVVACASGTVILREVQWDGGARQDALALLESGELAVGERLGVT